MPRAALSAIAVAMAMAMVLVPAAVLAAPPRISGIAFVDSSVTSQGSKAKLPANTKIHPPGARITGTEGCATDQYGTTGLIVAVIDYDGRPIAASLQVIAKPATGRGIERPPYYLDLNPGRTLQFLGPVRDNGTYELKLEGGFGKVPGEQVTAPSVTFTLARSCSR